MTDSQNSDSPHNDGTNVAVNQTIYINNINEKIRKDELRRSLYILCSQFGAILDIVSMRTPKMRGQAFVTFFNISSAANAVTRLKNFNFYGKSIRVSFARTKSDIVAKLDGSYRIESAKVPNIGYKKRKADVSGTKTQIVLQKNNGNNKGELSAKRADMNPPNKVLFVQKLSDSANEQNLIQLFSQIPGFVSVKISAGHKVAFVIYENEVQATKAMYEYQGVALSPNDQDGMFITYAK